VAERVPLPVEGVLTLPVNVHCVIVVCVQAGSVMAAMRLLVEKSLL
jgi:hypothetical protein